MPVSIPTLYREIQHAVGGRPSIASGETVAARSVRIINEAGRMLFGIHSWRFRETVALLDSVADQAYIVLPSDCFALNYAWWGYVPIRLVTPGTLEATRSLSGTATFAYMGCVRLTVTVDAPGGENRLELYPTPSDTTSDAVRILYNRQWADIDEDDIVDAAAYAAVPAYAEQVLIEFVRAVGVAYEDGGLQARIAEVVAGPSYISAKEQDSLLQQDFGPLTNVSPEALVFGRSPQPYLVTQILDA